MNEAPEAPASNGAEPLTQAYVEKTISSAIPESDLKYLGEDTPEKVVDKPEKKTTKKPEIGDSEIPLDDDEPEKVVEEGDEEEEEEKQAPEKRESDDAKSDAKWKQYREAYRENPKLKSENATLKAQLAKLGQGQEEVEQMRQHLTALSNERQRLTRLVEQGNIESSEIWNQQVMTPLNAMWEDIQTISKRNGMDPNHVANLLQSKDDEALNAYMDEHSIRPGDRHYLFGMIRDLDHVERTKQHLRANASELKKQSQQQMMSQRDNYFKQVSSQRTQAIEQIVPKIEQKILSILPKDKRRNLQNDVKHILDFGKWEPDIQMYAGVSAVVLPDLLDSYNLLRTQLKEAKTELLRFRGGAPRMSTGSPGKSRAPMPEEDAPAPDKLAKTSLTDFADESTKRIRQALGYRR